MGFGRFSLSMLVPLVVPSFVFASDENLPVQSFINTLTRVCIDAIDGNALYTGDQLTSGRVILSPNDVSLWGVDGGSFGGNCNFCSFGAGSGSAGFSAEFQKDTVAAIYDVLLKFKAFFLGVSRTDCASPAGDLLFGDHNGDNYSTCPMLSPCFAMSSSGDLHTVLAKAVPQSTPVQTFVRREASRVKRRAVFASSFI